MIMEIVMVLFLVLLALTICIGCEKLLHPKLDLAECTRQFKTDFKRVLGVLFGGDNARHIFDPSLWEDYLKILAEYAHTAFKPTCLASFRDGVPFIRIVFVMNRLFTREEVETLCNLLTLKLNQYLMAYGLSWRIFAEYYIHESELAIYMYYCEFKEDLPSFQRLYRIAVRRKTSSEYGMLHDEELDREVNHVKSKP